MKNVQIVLATVFVGAMTMSVVAETVNTVKVTTFHQSYPYSGKATIEYTVSHGTPREVSHGIMDSNRVRPPNGGETRNAEKFW